MVGIDLKQHIVVLLFYIHLRSEIDLFPILHGQAVLHTGDFRFCEEMTKISVLQTCRVQTLILDTTYCDPQVNL